jgi:integrase
MVTSNHTFRHTYTRSADLNSVHSPLRQRLFKHSIKNTKMAVAVALAAPLLPRSG